MASGVPGGAGPRLKLNLRFIEVEVRSHAHDAPAHPIESRAMPVSRPRVQTVTTRVLLVGLGGLELAAVTEGAQLGCEDPLSCYLE